MWTFMSFQIILVLIYSSTLATLKLFSLSVWFDMTSQVTFICECLSTHWTLRKMALSFTVIHLVVYFITFFTFVTTETDIAYFGIKSWMLCCHVIFPGNWRWKESLAQNAKRLLHQPWAVVLYHSTHVVLTHLFACQIRIWSMWIHDCQYVRHFYFGGNIKQHLLCLVFESVC